jgi:Integrase core domain
VGAEKSSTLCGLGVFVEEPAEPVMPDDFGIGVGGLGSARCGLACSRDRCGGRPAASRKRPRAVFDRLLIVDEHHLRRVLTEYLRHYNAARPHRSLGQLAPAQAGTRPPEINLAEHRIRRKQVLSGLTHEYQIAA